VRGRVAIKSFCKDLFNAKGERPSEDEAVSETEEPLLTTNMNMNFAQIVEERHEESPDSKADHSMQSVSGSQSHTEFKIQTLSCSQGGDSEHSPAEK